MKTGMEERVVLSQRTTEALKDLFRGRFSPLRELRSPSAAWAWGRRAMLWWLCGEGVLGCSGGLTVWCACHLSWGLVAKPFIVVAVWT